MDQFILQCEVAALSLLGFVALLPGPSETGELRIKGKLNSILTYTGIAFLIVPWLVLPFLAQPHMSGVLAPYVSYVGIFLIFVGVALYGVSLYMLLSAFRQQFTEFTPEKLITTGPYKLVRNPIYLAVLVILFGLYTALGAIYSLACLPFAFGVFRLITLYEERRILKPRFGEAYAAYKSAVPSAIFRRHGVTIFLLLCWVPLVSRLI